MLNEAEWDALRDSVASRGAHIILPCCGAEGFMRRSHLGTQHFAHKAGAPQCEMKGETVQHLKAKADIVRACRIAGYEASTEIAGADWRADVLAHRGRARIAFEVQWSFLQLEDCVHRQERYARDSVRGCWFFRRPPLPLQHAVSINSLELKARQDLPLFHLIPQADGDFLIQLNGKQYPLVDFVGALLSGKIRYCDHAVARETSRVRVVCMDMTCAHCGYSNVVYALDSRLMADCGLTFHAQRSLPADLIWQPCVQDALAAFCTTREGRLLRIGQAQARGTFGLSQGCVRCDHALPAEGIARMYRRTVDSGRDDWLGQFWAELPFAASYSSRAPHWCYPANGTPFCCG
jgi:hypothetical protein